MEMDKHTKSFYETMVRVCGKWYERAPQEFIEERARILTELFYPFILNPETGKYVHNTREDEIDRTVRNDVFDFLKRKSLEEK